MSDDGFGVNEALNETAYGEGLVVRGQHHILSGSLEDTNSLSLEEKELETQLALKPWIFISPVKFSFEELNEYFKMKANINIQNLRDILILFKIFFFFIP